MLLQFAVENYKSFKECAVLSMEASGDKEIPNNVTLHGQKRILNAAVIFGANAAGKSNLFLALTAAILTVRQSNNRQINEPLSQIMPFRFDTETATKPTSFEFVFIADDKKYVYGFSATRQEVVTEYLYVYHSAKASTVFERTKGDKYHFTSKAMRDELEPMKEKNTPNKLFLATATSWNCQSTRAPFLWLSERINTYSIDNDANLRFVAQMYADDEKGTLRDFTKRLLHQADISIDDYDFESKDVSAEDITRGLPPELQSIASAFPKNTKRLKIETVHTIEKDGVENRFKLGLQEESKGTQSLFMFSPVFKRAFETGETVCIDEFDANTHPLLAIYLIKLFANPEVNRAHAQLIASAHCTDLLSLELLRRDQIYFVEKNRKTSSSELYSLDEFSPRKDENIRKVYLQGRYGSVPDIPEEAEL